MCFGTGVRRREKVQSVLPTTTTLLYIDILYTFDDLWRKYETLVLQAQKYYILILILIFLFSYSLFKVFSRWFKALHLLVLVYYETLIAITGNTSNFGIRPVIPHTFFLILIFEDMTGWMPIIILPLISGTFSCSFLKLSIDVH